MLTKGLEVAVMSKIIDMETRGVVPVGAKKAVEDKEIENAKLCTTIQLMNNSNNALEEKNKKLLGESKEFKLKMEDLEKVVADKEKALKEGEETLRAKNEKLEKDASEIHRLVVIAGRVAELVTANNNLQDKTFILESSILEQLENGYNKELEHIKILNPGKVLVLEGGSPYHRIIDGKLVDPFAGEEGKQEEEEEDNEEHPRNEGRGEN